MRMRMKTEMFALQQSHNTILLTSRNTAVVLHPISGKKNTDSVVLQLFKKMKAMNSNSKQEKNVECYIYVYKKYRTYSLFLFTRVLGVFLETFSPKIEHTIVNSQGGAF